MNRNIMVSIIIRTKNEERWITQCLRGVFNQSYKNFEVIIIDSESADKTLEKAKQFDIAKIIVCEGYLPGKALNMGIKESIGKYIVCLSGHCVPTRNDWLSNLLEDFNESNVAGVYGRQEAMEFTSDADKRDLTLIFGLDRKIQLKDSLFHNANSMIRKDVWEKIPFDEHITNIEDRAWAKKVLEMGYKIIYEPKASVYHYHGIHQNGDTERCANVVRVLEAIHSDYTYKSIDVGSLNIIGLIPLRGKAQYLNGKPLLSYTIDRALESKYMKRVIVSTDSAETAKVAKLLSAEVPFLRNPHFSEPHINLAQVLAHSLEKLEGLKIFPDLIVSLEVTFPFRPKGLIDDMILQLSQNGLDSVVAAKRENKAIWKENDKEILQLVEGLTPRQFKEPVYIELKGLACVTHPEFIRQGNLLGQKIGIYKIDNPYSHQEVRNEEDLKMASVLVKEWFK